MRNCLQFNLNCLFCIGFWPKWEVRSRKKNILYYWRLVFPNLQVCRTIYGIFAQAYNIYLDWGTVSYMAEYLVILLIEIKVLLSMYILIAGRAKIENLVHGLQNMQDFKDGEEGKCKILERTNFIAQVLSILGCVIVGFVCVGVAVALTAYGLENRVIPYRKWFIVDVSTSPLFEMTLFTVMTAQTTDMFIIVIFDVFFLAIIIQVIGQYQLINYKLENINDLVAWEISLQLVLDRLKAKKMLQAQLKNKQEVSVHLENKVMHFANVANKRKRKGKQQAIRNSVLKQKREHVRVLCRDEREKCLASFSFGERDFETARFLQECVTHHLALIKLFHVLASLIEPHLVSQLVCNSLVSVIALYVTKLTVAVDIKVTVMCAIVFGSVVEFFVHCILGTLLLEYSGDLSYSMFSSDWTGFSHKVKRSMQIMMNISKKGVVFKALSIFPMTLEIFQKVGKFSYSLYTVFDQVSTGKKDIA